MITWENIGDRKENILGVHFKKRGGGGGLDSIVVELAKSLSPAKAKHPSQIYIQRDTHTVVVVS